jgi:uncharacterized protein (TIGR01244 family)
MNRKVETRFSDKIMHKRKLAELGVAEVRRFHEIVQAADKPVLAFCTSGFRCALLWALSEAAFGGATVDDALARAASAGHDLSKSRELAERILKT